METKFKVGDRVRSKWGANPEGVVEAVGPKVAPRNRHLAGDILVRWYSGHGGWCLSSEFELVEPAQAQAPEPPAFKVGDVVRVRRSGLLGTVKGLSMSQDALLVAYERGGEGPYRSDEIELVESDEALGISLEAVQALQPKAQAPSELHARQGKRLVEKDTLPRLLFKTDPEVIAFVDRVSEVQRHQHESRWILYADKAWDRYEPKGARERSEARAQALWEEMK